MRKIRRLWIVVPWVLTCSAALGAAPNVAETKPAVKTLTFGDDACINPPPMSLHINNATLPEAAAALSDALHAPLGCVDGVKPKDQAARFTLGVDKLGYWDVYQRLAAQNPISLFITLPGSNYLQTASPTYPALRTPVVSKGAAIFPLSLNRITTLDAPASPEGPRTSATLSFRYFTAFDPRTDICQCTHMEWSDTVDDLGNPIRCRKVQYDWHLPGVWSGEHEDHFDMPLGAGKRIPSLKGVMKVRVPAEEKVLEYPAIPFDEPITLEGATCRFHTTKREVWVGGEQTELSIQQKSEHEGWRVDSIVAYTFRNAPAEFEGHARLQGDAEGSLVMDDFPRPTSVSVAVTTKYRELELPFEFKNLPLP